MFLLVLLLIVCSNIGEIENKVTKNELPNSVDNAFIEKWFALVKGDHSLYEPTLTANNVPNDINSTINFQEPFVFPKIKITHHFKMKPLHSIPQITTWNDYVASGDKTQYADSYYKVYQFEGTRSSVMFVLYGRTVTEFDDTSVLFVEKNLNIYKQQFTIVNPIKKMDLNSTCRIAPNTGSTNGFKTGYFSYGLDVLDSRNVTMDLKYCPATHNGGDGVHVFILDTGFIDPVPSHINESRIIREYDAYPNGVFCGDLDGHGTHTGSLIVSNEYGGSPNVTLHVYKVLSDVGEGTLGDVLNGLVQILVSSYNDGIVSMSLGLYLGTGNTESPSFAIDNVIYQLINDKNFIVSASAGNDNSDACFNYPSNIQDVLSIGAITINKQKSSFSNYGSCISCFAPGSSIISTGLPPFQSAIYSGTSQANPIAVSIVALYKEYYGINETNTFIISKFLDFATVNNINGLDEESPNKVPYIGNFTSHSNPPPPPPLGNNKTKIVAFTAIHVVITVIVHVFINIL